MVARQDLARVNALYSENSDITQALAMFAAGGTIVNMTIGGEVAQPPPEEGGEEGEEQEPPVDLGDVTIDTSGWVYPPPMVEAIKGNLQQRQAEIKQELIALGVSGIEQAEPGE